jgi:hypothetical protein
MSPLVLDVEPTAVEMPWLLDAVLEGRLLHALLERLRAARPALAEALEAQGGQDFLVRIAEELAPYMGATKKFVDFVLTFLPPAPEVRPVAYYQYPWNSKGMKKGMAKVYALRSQALHGGVPFPAPMCHWPFPAVEGGLSEICAQIAMSTRGGVWVANDIPMSLHTFEYIVRGTLLNWWESLAQEQPASIR